MQIRDRIKRLTRVPAYELRPNPRNWRRHPPEQRTALRGILAEIGFAGAVAARELADGTLEIIDGHLRAETVADDLVPVLVLDVTAAEADKLLATFDTIGGRAECDYRTFGELLADLDLESEDVKALMTETLRRGEEADARGTASVKQAQDMEVLFQVVVFCGDEQVQHEVFERLVGQGLKCKLRCL